MANTKCAVVMNLCHNSFTGKCRQLELVYAEEVSHAEVIGAKRIEKR